MRKHTFLLLIGFCLMSFMSLNAQKFGYINTQELIEEIPEVKEANSNIETFRTQLQKKGQEMLQELQTKYQDLQRKEASGEISPVELQKEADKLKTEEQTILQFEQESQQKVLQKSEDLLKPLRDRIQQAIDDVASEHGYDYIFDFSTGVVLYADDSTDVSALVKAKL